MAIKKVELLEVNAPHDIIYPVTSADCVLIGDDQKPLDTALNEIGSKIGNFVPTTGGTMTGKLVANGGIDVTGLNASGNIAGASLYANGTNTGKRAVISAGGSDVYMHNTASNKYLQLKDNGELHYDNHTVWHSGNLQMQNKLDAVHPVNGNWWRGVPQVNGDGVTEVGKYIDFHNSNTGSADFNARITCDGDKLVTSGAFTSSGNLGTNTQIWCQDRRVAAKASHGGLDLGNTNAKTTIQSNTQPTWWNGSNDVKLTHLETNDRSMYIGSKCRLGTGSNNDIFFVNTTANVYLSMKDDGRMTYGGKEVITSNSSGHNVIRYGGGLSGANGFITFTW